MDDASCCWAPSKCDLSTPPGQELGLRVKEQNFIPSVKQGTERGSQAPPEHHPADEGQAGPPYSRREEIVSIGGDFK